MHGQGCCALISCPGRHDRCAVERVGMMLPLTSTSPMRLYPPVHPHLWWGCFWVPTGVMEMDTVKDWYLVVESEGCFDSHSGVQNTDRNTANGVLYWLVKLKPSAVLLTELTGQSSCFQSRMLHVNNATLFVLKIQLTAAERSERQTQNVRVQIISRGFNCQAKPRRIYLLEKYIG